MAENLKASEISEILLNQLKDIHETVGLEEIGEVLQVSDGVVRIYGLVNAEAGELLECFQWGDTGYDLDHVREELADVIVYCQNMLDELGLDADEIVNSKMDKNEAKYPVEKAKGSSAKYTEL